MDSTEWIALTIVGLAVILLIRTLAGKRKEKRKSCCSQGCPLDSEGDKNKCS